MAFLAGSLGRQEMRYVRERSDPAWVEAETSVLSAARHFQQVRALRPRKHSRSRSSADRGSLERHAWSCTDLPAVEIDRRCSG